MVLSRGPFMSVHSISRKNVTLSITHRDTHKPAFFFISFLLPLRQTHTAEQTLLCHRPKFWVKHFQANSNSQSATLTVIQSEISSISLLSCMSTYMVSVSKSNVLKWLIRGVNCSMFTETAVENIQSFIKPSLSPD